MLCFKDQLQCAIPAAGIHPTMVLGLARVKYLLFFSLFLRTVQKRSVIPFFLKQTSLPGFVGFESPGCQEIQEAPARQFG